VLSGLDESGQFTEPPEQIKKDMEEMKRDTQMPQTEKEQAPSERQRIGVIISSKNSKGRSRNKSSLCGA
jgi:hypothetical protein